jgi:FkbM family methyltransferase
MVIRYEPDDCIATMRPAAADLRTRIFQRIADRFPSPAIESSLGLRRLWKTMFYLSAPQAPFVMRTARYRLWVDPAKRKDIARSILHRGAYEPIETAIVLDRLRPGMTVIDVGANIGHYAMVASAAVGTEGRVVAFEPDPENHAALAANLALNGFSWAVAERMALAATPGEATLYRDDANRGGHSLSAANVQRHGGETVVVVTTLDAYAAAHLPGRRIDFIKIDVQGAEADVLAGAAATLARDMPDLLVEFWPHGIRARGAEPMTAIERMLALGYRMAVIDRNHPGHVRPLPDLDALRRIDLSDPQAYANLLFTKDNAGR